MKARRLQVGLEASRNCRWQRLRPNRAGEEHRQRIDLQAVPRAVIYSEGNERTRRRFPDLATAKAEANLIVTKLANRESEVLKLSPAGRAIYMQSLGLLRDLQAKLRAPESTPLNYAVKEYAEGPVSPVSGENRLHDAVVAALRECRTARKAKLPFRWKRNGLRHAFCSYRLSVTQDLNRLALEAG
ncbi:MAG: hypothetical protein ABMA26_26465, partial [Limisphaerales bacterium]